MKHQPTTERQNSENDGRPCIHITDEDDAGLQVHHRGDQPTGFTVMTDALLPMRLMGGVVMVNAQVGVYLTHSQAQELCDYFRSVL